MNLRNVLRAYGLLRQLSDDESALLNILRALNDNDREQLVASMSDKPQKKSSKKAAGRDEQRCTYRFEFSGAVCNRLAKNSSHHDERAPDFHQFQGVKSSSKSARASGMAAQLNKQLDRRRKEPEVGGFADDADMVCAYQYPNDSAVNAGLRCGEGSINGVHDKAMGYAGYHEFVAPPTTGKSDAQSAAGGS